MLEARCLVNGRGSPYLARQWKLPDQPRRAYLVVDGEGVEGRHRSQELLCDYN